MIDFTNSYADITNFSWPNNGFIRFTLETNEAWIPTSDGFIIDTRQGGSTSFAKQNELNAGVYTNGDFLSVRVNGSNQSTWDETNIPGDDPASTCSLQAYGDVITATSLRLFADQDGNNNSPQKIQKIEILENNLTTVVHEFDLTNPVGSVINDSVGSAVLTLTTPPDAPILSSPTSNVSESTVTPEVTTDTDNGTIYMVMVPDGDVPSVTQIKAGQQSNGSAAIASQNQAVSATGVQSFTAINSIPNGDYELYFVHTNSTPDDSTASTVGFNINVITPGVTLNTASFAFGDTITFTPANMGTITGAKLIDSVGNEMVLTVLSDTQGTIPSLGAGQRCLMGTVTLEITDGTNTVQDTLNTGTLNPPTGYSTVTLVSGFETTNPTYLSSYTGTVQVGDQFLYQTTDFDAFDNLGHYEASAGDYTFYGISSVDGQMESAVLTLGGIPVITLLGSASVIIAQGDTYTDAGATAADAEDGDITADIVTVNPVNTSVVGTYTVTYNVDDSDGNSATEVTRSVEVVVPADTTPPVITLIGSSTINVNQGNAFSDPGATATDNVDGDISGSIVVGGDSVDVNTPATYTITYDVADTAGNNATQVTRTVIVTAVDSVAPVITMLGTSPVNVTQGDTYTDAGATATDETDGDITDDIISSGTVDTNTIGSYTITYNVSDAAGNAATPVQRTVNVIAETLPDITSFQRATVDNSAILTIGSDFDLLTTLTKNRETFVIAANAVVSAKVIDRSRQFTLVPARTVDMNDVNNDLAASTLLIRFSSLYTGQVYYTGRAFIEIEVDDNGSKHTWFEEIQIVKGTF